MKTTKPASISFLIIILLIGFSCTSTSKTEESEEESSTAVENEATITLTKAPPSPQFPEANLELIGDNRQDQDSGVFVTHAFNVSGFELQAQTEDAAERGIANSGKGQHIHFIVNNGPYAAHYMDAINNAFEEGNWTILAFLSRSYHESVKGDNAYYISNMTVGDPEGEPTDLTAQHLFYSRPKGTYAGADAQKVMLDFYLLNTTLSAEGNKVRATINGNEFMIDEWAPHYIEGLPMGENTIELELVDMNGNLIEGPFNSVTRTITLQE